MEHNFNAGDIVVYISRTYEGGDAYTTGKKYTILSVKRGDSVYVMDDNGRPWWDSPENYVLADKELNLPEWF